MSNTDDMPPATPITMSPRQRANAEAQERIKASRDKILTALSDLHPEEQLDVAQAVLNALRILNERVLKKQQLAKLQAELGEA